MNHSNPLPPAAAMDPVLFRSGMSRLASACTIVTARHQDERAGLTATAVCSVSAEPPRLLVCVNRNVRAHHLITASARLGVNVLAAHQEDLARRFAGMVQGVAGNDRFLAGHWVESQNGVPLLNGALVQFDCVVIQDIPSGTHSIFLCEVTATSLAEPTEAALLYFNRQFAPLAVESMTV